MSFNELIIEVFKKIDEQLLKLQSTRSFKIIILITIVITSFGWIFAYGYLLNKSTIELAKMKPTSMFFYGNNYPDAGLGLVENKKLIQEKCKKENDTQGIVLYLKEGYFLTRLKNNIYIGKYYKKDSFSSKINMMDFNVVYKFKEGDMEIFSTSFKNFCDNLH